MFELLKKFSEKILDIVFPKEQVVLELEEMIKNNRLRELPEASESPATFIHSLFNYKDSRVRALVWAIKYRGNSTLSEAVGELLYELILEEVGDTILLENQRHFIIIPIPLSKRRYHERGFNQAELIAGAVVSGDSEKTFLLKTNILVKTKHTSPQTSLRRSSRLRNLIGCFEISNPDILKGKVVIIIDDVSTTGGTLKEARKTLLAAGAKKVIAFVIAH